MEVLNLEKSHLSQNSFNAVQSIVSAINLHMNDKYPLVVSLDGGSGAGKSTLAAGVTSQLGAAVIHCDDFLMQLSLTTIGIHTHWSKNAVVVLTGNVCLMKHYCLC